MEHIDNSTNHRILHAITEGTCETYLWRYKYACAFNIQCNVRNQHRAKEHRTSLRMTVQLQVEIKLDTEIRSA